MLDNKKLEKYNQEHLIEFEKLMSTNEKERLAEQVKAIDLAEVQHLYETAYLQRETVSDLSQVDEVNYDIANMYSESERASLERTGKEAIAAGRFAVVLMAGGQGTRLGYKGPKGTFEIEGVSLFELQARQLMRLMEETGTAVDWYIMTLSLIHI